MSHTQWNDDEDVSKRIMIRGSYRSAAGNRIVGMVILGWHGEQLHHRRLGFGNHGKMQLHRQAQ